MRRPNIRGVRCTKPEKTLKKTMTIKRAIKKIIKKTIEKKAMGIKEAVPLDGQLLFVIHKLICLYTN